MKHRFAGLNEGGKMEDGVEGSSLGFGGDENIFKSGAVCQFPLDKIDVRK
jgi:hypothetical protein